MSRLGINGQEVPSRSRMLGTGSGTETNAIERPPCARRYPSFQRAAVITFHPSPSMHRNRGLFLVNCWWLSGSANSYLAVLLAIWQIYWPYGSAAGCLAVLLHIWQCCQLSGSAAGYLVVLLLYQFCRLSGSAVNYLAVLPTIWQTICQ